MPVLRLDPPVIELAKIYAEQIDLPARAFADSLHLAIAAYHAMDFLLTWNCRHIASGRVRRAVESINGFNRVATPIICTPNELMEL